MEEKSQNTVIVTTDSNSDPGSSNLPARLEPRCEIDAPALITTSGDGARYAYEEFLRGDVENKNTYRAYKKALDRFLDWAFEEQLEFAAIRPGQVREYLEELRNERNPERELSKPSKKLHLAAIRRFFDIAVTRHVVILNPAASVRGPKVRQRKGKTTPFAPDQVEALLASIDTSSVVGLRDRAILGTLAFTAARAGAVGKLRFRDYWTDGKQWFFSFDEKGGNESHKVPVRIDLQRFIDAYVKEAGIEPTPDSPIFRTARGRTRTLTENAVTENVIYRMLRRRLKDAELPHDGVFKPHSFRAATITDLLAGGAELRHVQKLAGHADPRTTQLYDHSDDSVTQNLVEKISYRVTGAEPLVGRAEEEDSGVS